MWRKRWPAAAALLAVLLAGCDGKLVGRGEEMRLGQEADRVITRQYVVSRDAQHQSLVEQIGRQVAAQSTRPEIPFTFRVLDEKEINAMAVPGFVYVNRGLIEFANADSDLLAAVIAHEVAHTTERHMAKQIERTYGATFLLTMLSSGERNTVDALAQIAAELALSGNSRQDERAADAQGLRFMARAGYDPWAMPRFFEQLRKQSGDVRGLNKYFSSHPSNVDRITRAEAMIRKEGLAPEPAAPATAPSRR